MANSSDKFGNLKSKFSKSSSSSGSSTSSSSTKSSTSSTLQTQYNVLRNLGFSPEDASASLNTQKTSKYVPKDLDTYSKLRDQGYSKKDIESGNYEGSDYYENSLLLSAIQEKVLPILESASADSKDYNARFGSLKDISGWDTASANSVLSSYADKSTELDKYMHALKAFGYREGNDIFDSIKGAYDFYSDGADSIRKNNRNYSDYKAYQEQAAAAEKAQKEYYQQNYMYHDEAADTYYSYDDIKAKEAELREEKQRLDYDYQGYFAGDEITGAELSAFQRTREIDAELSNYDQFISQQDAKKKDEEWFAANLADGRDSYQVYQDAAAKYDAASAKVDQLKAAKPVMPLQPDGTDPDYEQKMQQYRAEMQQYKRGIAEWNKQMDYAAKSKAESYAAMEQANRYSDYSIAETANSGTVKSLTAIKEGQSAYEKILASDAAAQETFNASMDPRVNQAGYDLVEALYADRSYKRVDTSKWDPEQQNAYYYLLGTGETERADRYAENVNNAKNAEARYKDLKQITDWQVEHPGLGTLASFGAGVVLPLASGMGEYLMNTEEYLGRGTITQKDYYTPIQLSQAMVSTTADQLNKMSGVTSEALGPIGGKGAGDVYQLAVSVAQSLLAVTVGGEYGSLAMFFGSAASSGIYDALDRGLEPGKALALGTFNGLAEVLGEKFSVENLINGVHSDAAIKGALKALLVQAGIEGSEEGFTTLLNTAADLIINGDKNELNIAYMENLNKGLSREEASRLAAADWFNGLAYDMISGAASGGLSAGLRVVTQKAKSAGAYKGDANSVIDALSAYEGVDGNTRVGELVGQMREKVSEKGKISNYDADVALDNIKYYATKQAQEEAKGHVKNKLVEAGLTSNQANTIADYVAENSESIDTREAGWEKKLIRGTGLQQSEDLTAKIKDAIYGVPELIRSRGSSMARQLRAMDIESKTDTAKNKFSAEIAENEQLKKDIEGYREQLDALDGEDEVTKAQRRDLEQKISEAQSRIQDNNRTVSSFLSNTDTHNSVKIDGDSYYYAGTRKQGDSFVVDYTTKDGKTVTMDVNDSRLPADAKQTIDKFGGMFGENLDEAVAVYDMNPDMDINDFEAGFKWAVEMGQDGASLQALLDKRVTKGLSREQFTRAYNIGRRSFEAETAKKGGRRYNRTKGSFERLQKDMSVDGETIHAVSKDKVVSKEQYNFVRAVANALKLRIVLYESQSYTDKNGVVHYEGAQGIFTASDGTIYIDVNAGLTKSTDADIGKATLNYTLSHEITHYLQETSPSDYAILKQFVIDNVINESEKGLEAIVAEKLDRSVGRELTYTEAVDEVVADSCEEVLTNSKLLEQLMLENAGVAKKAIAKAKSILKSIRDSLIGTARDEARAQQKYMDKLVELWDNALRSSMQEQASEGNGNEKISGSKNANRDYNPIREKLAKEGLDELSEKLGDRFPLSSNFDSVIRNDNTPLNTYDVIKDSASRLPGESKYQSGKRIYNAAYGNGITTIHLDALDSDASLSFDTIRESLAKGGEDVQARLDSIPQLKEMLETGVLLGIERVHTDNRHVPLYGYRIYNAFNYQTVDANGVVSSERRILVATVVQSVDNAHAYVFRDIDSAVISNGSTSTGSSAAANNSAINTIALLYKTVKRISRNDGGLLYSDKQASDMLFPYTARNDGTKYSVRGLSENVQKQLTDNGITVQDGVVVSNSLAKLMQEQGYSRPFDYQDAKYSMRTYAPWRRSYMANGGDAAVADAMEEFTTRMIMDDAIWNYAPNGDYAYTKRGPLRTNQEYLWSFDMDTSCPRTFQFLNYRDSLQATAGRPLTFAESINLLNLMKVYGQQIPCTYCYVENKRIAKSSDYLNFFRARHDVLAAETDEEALKSMYSYDEKKGTVTDAARKVFDQWRKLGRDAYNPTADENWTAWHQARNSVFNYLDSEQLLGRVNVDINDKNRLKLGMDGKKGASVKALVNRVCDKFNIKDKDAVAEIRDFVNEWLYYANSAGERKYGVPNDGKIGNINEEVLTINRAATNYASSSSSAKLVENYQPYTDQLKSISAADKAYILGMGGIRKHSSNDFRFDYVQDYLLFYADLAAGGWTGHTYSKSVDFVKMFGRCGDRINMSIAMETTPDGMIRENEQEGMKWSDARALQKAYKNAGVMAMVTDDAQLSYALNNDWIQMIIPFHHSGLRKEVWYNLRMWSDYTSVQMEQFFNSDEKRARLEGKGYTREQLKKMSTEEVDQAFRDEFKVIEVFNSKGKQVKPHFLPNDTVVSGPNGEKQTIPGHHNDVQRYFELCEQYGVRPRFQGVKVADKDGNIVDVTDHPGYLKLLKETARTDSEQEAIRFNFDQYDPYLKMSPMDFALQRMKELADEGGYESQKDDPLGLVKTFERDYLGKDREIGWLSKAAQSFKKNVTDKAYAEMYQADQNILDKMAADRAEAEGVKLSARDLPIEEREELDDGTRFSLRQGPAPKNVQWGFKLMNVDENGLPHAMFIDAAKPYEIGTWYDADSPNMKALLKLEPGYAYLVDENDNADMDSRIPVTRKASGFGGLPSKRLINEATATGKRWMVVDKYSDGSLSIHNVGINGSGTPSTFAIRPGIHAVDIPSMRHIGAKSEGAKKIDSRRPDQRWFLIEYPIDVDYNQEAYANARRDIRDHLPTDGWYSFQTNSGAEAKQHWFITGGMRIVGAVSEEDVRAYARSQGFEEDIPWKMGKTYDDSVGAVDLMKYAAEHQDTRTPSKTEMRERIEAERGSARFSQRDVDDAYVTYNNRAVVSEDTLEQWLKDYAASNPNYAQAYIAYMSPPQFLKLTTKGIIERNHIREQSENTTAEEAQNRARKEPIFLRVDVESGEVYGHEGRHRMVALDRAGVTKVPVLLFDSHNKNSKIALDEATFVSQFGPDISTVKNLQPLSRGNIDNVRQMFSTKTTMEKMGEKYNGNRTAMFSRRDSAGNQLSEQQSEYFKDSKIRDEDGNLLVVYHGTDADFTVFDRTKGRANMDIQGSFFSPWEIDAGGYGANVNAYYLNITNPAPEGVAYRALNRFKGQNGAGIKAREYLESLGYDGVNNGGEEYIAFNPEQIKLTSNTNPTSSNDIRFQMRDNSLTDREILLQAFEDAVTTKAQREAMKVYKKGVESYRFTMNEYREAQRRLAKAPDNIALKAVVANLEKKAAEQNKNLRAQELHNKPLGEILSADNRIAKGLIDSEYREKYNTKYAALDKEKRRLQAELNRTNKKDATAIRKLQEKIADRDQKIKDLREERDRKVAETRKHYQDMAKRNTAQRRESAAAGSLKDRVWKQASTLNEWLTANSDKEHIPEALKRPIAEFLETIDFSSKRRLAGGPDTGKDVRFLNKLRRLEDVLNNQKAYQEGSETAGSVYDGYIDLDPETLQAIHTLVRQIESTTGENFTVNEMNSEQLKALNDALTAITKAVKTMNRFFANRHYQGVYEASESTIDFLQKLGPAAAITGKATDLLLWNNTNPYYAFKRFGDAGQAVFDAFATGWDKLAMNAKQIIDFTESLYTDKEVKDWENNVRSFTMEDGSVIKITDAQIMGLYELLKRDQAVQHIQGGGVRIGNIGEGVKKIVDTEHHHFTATDLAKLTAMLSPKQIEVADKLQRFMNTVGTEWGNSVSMERFGYKFFTEDNYYPIKTDENDIPKDSPDAQGNEMFRLLNMSATKGLIVHANNALVVSSIFDVFADHMSDMAKYNALALPILDAMKWYNFKSRVDNGDGTFTTRTVKKSMEKAWGNGSKNYFTTFIKDLNGVREGGRGDDWINKLFISNYKVASVGANIRVALLQPTSYVRAGAVINPKYLMKAMRMKGNIKEAIKYSGTAVWKDLGYFDTNIARNMREQIKHDDGVMDKVREASMLGAEYGDKWTWGKLWTACKLQVQDTQKPANNEDLMKKTADLFRETVYATQVMDSTMTRSHTMRNTSGLATLTTAFMSEPTLSYNMVLDAVMKYRIGMRSGMSREEAWKQNKKPIMRAFLTYAMTAAAAAAVESFVDAMRDDDDYESFADKYMEAMMGSKVFDGNLVGDLDLIQKLPVIKDVVSLASGYSNERMDTQYITNSIKAFKIWKETYQLWKGTLEKPTATTYYGKMTTWGKVFNTMKAASQIVGLPFSSLQRDIQALWNNTVGNFAEGMKLKTYAPSPKSAIEEAYANGYISAEQAQQYLMDNGVAEDEDAAYFMVKSFDGEGKYDAVVDAAMAGDTTAYKAGMDELEEHGVREKDAYSKVKSEIKLGYLPEEGKEQTVSKDEAVSRLVKYADMSKEDAKALVNIWTCELVTGIPYSSIKDEYLDGKITADRAESLLVKYGGKTKEDAADAVDKYRMEKEYGIAYSDLKDAVIRGKITPEKAVSALMKYGGKTREEADKAVTYYQFLKENPNSLLSDSKAVAYMRNIKPLGIPLKDFEGLITMADTDGNGSYTQNETGTYITDMGYTGEKAEALWNAITGGNTKTTYDLWTVKYGADSAGNNNNSVSQAELGPYLVNLIQSGKLSTVGAQAYWESLLPTTKTTFAKWCSKNHIRIG